MIRTDLVVAPPAAPHGELSEQWQSAGGDRRELLERLLAAAEEKPAPLAVEVEAGREVDGQRQLEGQCVARLREEDVAPLRLDRNGHAGGRAELLRPHARGEYHAPCRDTALTRVDADHVAVLDGDPLHAAALDDAGPEGGGCGCVALRRGLRRRVAVDRAERRREDVVDAQPGDDAAGLVGADEPRRHAEALLQLHRPRERRDLPLGRQQEEIAPLLEVDLPSRLLGEVAVAADALEGDANVELVRELGADPAGRLARRAGRQSLAFDEHAIAAAGLRQVVESARAHDAAADDHDLRACR